MKEFIDVVMSVAYYSTAVILGIGLGAGFVFLILNGVKIITDIFIRTLKKINKWLSNGAGNKNGDDHGE